MRCNKAVRPMVCFGVSHCVNLLWFFEISFIKAEGPLFTLYVKFIELCCFHFFQLLIPLLNPNLKIYFCFYYGSHLRKPYHWCKYIYSDFWNCILLFINFLKCYWLKLEYDPLPLKCICKFRDISCFFEIQIKSF